MVHTQRKLPHVCKHSSLTVLEYQRVNIFSEARIEKCIFNSCFSRVDACVQGLSLSHIVASASCCFSSLL